MIAYQNISFSAKTFYGVKFEPGETKAVPGYINSVGMVRVFDFVDEPTELVEPTPVEPVIEHKQQEEVTATSTRGRKKKSSEPEKSSVAEDTEITLLQEEISNGNPS